MFSWVYVTAAEIVCCLEREVVFGASVDCSTGLEIVGEDVGDVVRVGGNFVLVMNPEDLTTLLAIRRWLLIMAVLVLILVHSVYLISLVPPTSWETFLYPPPR